MDNIECRMSSREGKNQQLGEKMIEIQIIIEGQEETKDNGDDMPILENYSDEDLKMPLSGRVFKACDDFDSRTNHFEKRGNDMNYMEKIQLITRMDQKEYVEDNGSHEVKIKLDGPCLNHEDNALNDDLKNFNNYITCKEV